MKINLFILLLLLGNNAFTQTELLGKYCRLAEGVILNIQKDDKCITFLPNNMFRYYNSYDHRTPGYKEYGKGSYRLSKDTLILMFTNKDPKFINTYDIQKTLNPSSDSILIDLQLYSLKDTTPINFANVYIKDSVSFKNKKILGGFSTDIAGHGYKTLSTPSGNFWLEIRSINFPKCYIELTNNCDYKITGYIVADDSECIYGEVWKFLIITNKNKTLRIKNLADKKISLFQLIE